MDEGGDKPLDVLAESASGYQVYGFKNSIDSCGNSDIPDSVSLSDSNSYELLPNFAVVSNSTVSSLHSVGVRMASGESFYS